MNLNLKMFFKFSLLVCFAIVLFSKVHAFEFDAEHGSSENYTFAHYLYDNGDYENAAYEFIRLYLEETDSLKKSEYAYTIGVSFYNVKRYKDGYRYLKIADGYSDSQELITKIYIETNQYKKAVESLSELDEDERLWQKAKIFRLSGEYEKEEAVLAEINQKQDSEYFEVSSEIYETINSPLETKSYLNAFLISLLPLPPGAGYLYTQRYGDAIFANVFIISLAALGGIYYYADSPNRAYLAWTIAGGFHLSTIYGSLVSVKLFNKQVEKNRDRKINDLYEKEREMENIWFLSY